MKTSALGTSAVGVRKVRHQLIAYAGSFAALMLAVVAPTESASAEIKRLRYAVATAVPNISASYYTSLPQLLGYWELENLDIAHANLSGGNQVAQGLVAGSVDVGATGINSIIPLVQNGAPLVGYYATSPVQYSWPAVLPDSPIKGVRDLAGKTFGVPSLESSTVQAARAFVVLGGGDAATAKFLAVGVGADAMVALQRGDIDALMLWDGPYADIEERGQPLRLIQDSEVANNAGFQSAVVANRHALKDSPEAYVGLARSIAKSLVFIRANPECAVYAHWHSYPASRPAGVPEQDALEQAVRIWKAREQYTGAIEGKWGYTTEENIAANLKFYELGGLIHPGLKPSDVADLSLIDEINDFDEEAVKAQARACDFPWKPK